MYKCTLIKQHVQDVGPARCVGCVWVCQRVVLLWLCLFIRLLPWSEMLCGWWTLGSADVEYSSFYSGSLRTEKEKYMSPSLDNRRAAVPVILT